MEFKIAIDKLKPESTDRELAEQTAMDDPGFTAVCEGMVRKLAYEKNLDQNAAYDDEAMLEAQDRFIQSHVFRQRCRVVQSS